jgi:DNA polymerase III subunit gamma/tau
MSQFVVSARKYRPQRFSDVVGQSHVSVTLKNALRTEHVAHAFLFCGPRGVGKTTNARILAKILNCTDLQADYEACGKCSSCESFDQSASFNIFELDAASNNSVDHIRSLVEQTRIPPQQGRYKVFIIDEVHMLSQAAFNAFLKTLEEPPAHAIFILATTEKHKIIPTILSRCQIFDFRRIQIPDIVAHLQKICDTEGLTAEPDALHIIAQKADGALRDALSIFDRIVSASTDKSIRYDDVIENLNVLDYDYFFKLTDALLLEDLSSVMNIFDDILKKGFDPEIFINGLAEHIRNILVSKDLQTLQLLEVGEVLKVRYQKQAVLSPMNFLLTALNLCNDCDVNFKTARNKRLHVEMTLIKTTYIQRAVDLATMPQQTVEVVEKKTNVVSKKGEKAPESVVPTLSPEQESAKQVPPLDNLGINPDSDKISNIPLSLAKGPTVEMTESERPPGPAVSTITKSSGLGLPSMPKIGSLDSMAKLIEDEEAILAQAVSKLTFDNLVESWKKYAESHESPSAKMAILGATLDLNDKKIVARVGTELAMGFIKSEFKLCDFLRFDLSEQALTLEVKFDKMLAPEETAALQAKKFLSPREKLKLMMEVNPLVKDLAVKLNLKPDE